MGGRILVIGAVACDHEALAAWVAELPPDLGVPVVVVAHGAPAAASVATALHAHSRLPVSEVEDKAELAPATLHVAPADYHLLVEEAGSFALSTEAPLWGVRPAIDPLFESTADAYGAHAIAVLIGGEGPDGVRGLARIGELGGVALKRPPVAEVVRLLGEG